MVITAVKFILYVQIVGSDWEVLILEIGKAKVEHETDKKEELIKKLTSVLVFIQELLTRLEGEDPPVEEQNWFHFSIGSCVFAQL